MSTAAFAVARALRQADVTADEDAVGAFAGSGVSVGAVFVLTLLMAGASGLGAVPFFFVGRLSPKLAGVANALACGGVVRESQNSAHDPAVHRSFVPSISRPPRQQ